MQDYVVENSVWQYTNPDQPPATPPQEPIKPQISDVARQPSNTFTSDEPSPTRLIDLTPNQVSIYRILLDEYNSSRSDFKQYIRSIQSLKQGIQSSLTPEGRKIINGLSPRDAIIQLRATFARSDQSKNRQILRDWDEIKRQAPPSKSSQLTTWGQRWIICKSQGSQANISHFQDPLASVYDFLEAIQPSDQGFYTFWCNTILQGLQQPTLTELVNLFVEQYRPIAPSTHNRRQIAHQTYQGKNPDDEPEETPTKPGRKGKGTCPCKGPPSNGYHDFDQCSYINPLVRPKDWKPSRKAQQAFKQRCEYSLGFKKAYQHAIKKHQKSDEPESDEIVESDESPESTKRDAFSVYIPREQTNDIFRSNDSKAMSTIWVSAKKNDIWCYDTGASIHVTNNRDLLSNYRPVVSSVMVGNTETTILGYGELTVTPTKSLDGSTFPLKHIAYCPGFHINLISAERAASAGIYYNGKNSTLEEGDGTLIC